MTLELMAKATVILVAALGATLFMRRRSAAARALLLSSALIVSLAIPALALVAPAIHLSLPERPAATGSSSARPSADVQKVLEPVSVSGTTTAPPGRALSLSQLVKLVWVLGLLGSAAPIAVAMGRAHGIRRRAGHDRLSRREGADCAPAGVEILDSSEIRVPMAVGLTSPTVLMPDESVNWEPGQRERAMAHELEHIRRGDLITIPLARLAAAVHWYNPLAWLAWRRFRLEMERACDDAVVAHGDHVAYAEQLVELARRLGARPSEPLVSMAARTDLTARVTSVLDGSVVRGRVTTLTARLCAVTALLCSVLLASIQVAASQGGAQPELAPRSAPVKGGGTVMGIVRDPTGAPLDGLLLILERNCFGPEQMKGCDFGSWTRSDRDGRFRFSGLPRGSFHITSPIDFFPGIQFNVAMGQTIERDISMAVDPVVSEFTICATCPALIIPDSLAKEFEADRKDALDHPVSAPSPAGGWEFYKPGKGDYPADLKDAGVEGSVVIEGRIGLDGVPTAMKAEPAGTPLARAAIDALAVEMWEPGRVRGVAIEVPFRFLIRYSIH